MRRCLCGLVATFCSALLVQGHLWLEAVIVSYLADLSKTNPIQDSRFLANPPRGVGELPEIWS